MTPHSASPRSDSWPRLPVAIGGAARLDVLLFSGAAAVVALHALVDAFVGRSPARGRAVLKDRARWTIAPAARLFGA